MLVSTYLDLQVGRRLYFVVKEEFLRKYLGVLSINDDEKTEKSLYIRLAFLEQSSKSFILS